MKTQLLTFALALALGQTAIAKNTTQKIDKVTSSVTVSENVDYIVTGTTPFSTTGSINITNTEHAVVILENLKPSKALSYLSFIKINGEPAVNDENCQVKMYAHGTIIMPYDKDFKPLTVYSEPNFGGESVNDFGLENSNGYMNTLSTAKLNNRIRSFRLKRGYMVTFSNNPNGRGYSRCFIADKEDLEFAELPLELDHRISSYRVFKWNDTEKKGIANTTDYQTTQDLNVGWCYSFGPGEDRGIDCECVPHKIEVVWPGNCGTLTYSAYLKTNNEPGNPADHGTESVESVLNTWEDLMATGKRLCSPSSHDGSLNWMREFMNTIDERGWRCDIVDVHCYWPEWNLNNALKGWYDDYKRPLWISEFVWGASWNKNGIFGAVSDWDSKSEETQQKNYDVMSKVLTNWNTYPYVERYAYWNSERNCSKIRFDDGSLSKLGKFYTEMKSGIGYNKSYEFVPKVVYSTPSGLTLEYTERTRKLALNWEYKNNMGFTDSTLLEMRLDDGEWQTLQKYEAPDKSSYAYNEFFPEDFKRGTYTYRVRNFDMDGNVRSTDEVQLSLVAAKGEPGFQYGTLEISDTQEFNTEFDAIGEDEKPAVFAGLLSYNDSKVVPVNTVVSVLSDKFSFWAFPWNKGDYEQTITKPETTDFMVLRKGAHQIGEITMEVGESASKIKNDTTWISFATPFPEGVTPVVIANVLSRYKAYPYVVKVWDITNKGFAVKLARQAAVDETTSTFAGQDIFYVAATPGTAKMDDGKILTVGRNTEDKVDGRRAREVNLVDETGNAIGLFSPIMLFGPQTNNYDCASVYRISSYTTDESNTDIKDVPATTGVKIIRQKDKTNETIKEIDNATNNGDIMGWIAVSSPKKGESGIKGTIGTAPFKVFVRDGHVIVDGTDNYRIYAISGQQVPRTARLSRGIYVVKAGSHSVKVMVP